LIRLSAIALLRPGSAKPAKRPLRKPQVNTSKPPLKTSNQSKNLLPSQRKKTRATEQNTIAGIIVNAARKVLADVQQRCIESLKALDQHDYLVVIGALAGLEDQIRYVTVRLMVLREINEIQKQNHIERRNT
jgi:hypothetical protein